MDLRALYQELLELLAFVTLYAPTFPSSVTLTTERAIQQLFDLFSKIQDQEQNKDALIWLNLCHEELRAGREAYVQRGDRIEGARRLREAKRYLTDAQKRKSHAPDFIAGPNREEFRNPLKAPEQSDSN